MSGRLLPLLGPRARCHRVARGAARVTATRCLRGALSNPGVPLVSLLRSLPLSAPSVAALTPTRSLDFSLSFLAILSTRNLLHIRPRSSIKLACQISFGFFCLSKKKKNAKRERAEAGARHCVVTAQPTCRKPLHRSSPRSPLFFLFSHKQPLPRRSGTRHIFGWLMEDTAPRHNLGAVFPSISLS